MGVEDGAVDSVEPGRYSVAWENWTRTIDSLRKSKQSRHRLLGWLMQFITEGVVYLLCGSGISLISVMVDKFTPFTTMVNGFWIAFPIHVVATTILLFKMSFDSWLRPEEESDES